MNTPTRVSYTHPAGKYYVGDLCYALEDSVYTNVWGGQHKYKMGSYLIESNGKQGMFSVNRTLYGDGLYLDKNSGFMEFMVDAGIIGILPYDLCDPNEIKNGMIHGGHIIESSTEVEFDSNDGYFVITYNKNDDDNSMIIIETGIDSDDEDDNSYETYSDESEVDEVNTKLDMVSLTTKQ